MIITNEICLWKRGQDGAEGKKKQSQAAMYYDVYKIGIEYNCKYFE